MWELSGGGSSALSDVQKVLFGDLAERPADLQQLAKVMLTSALSPAGAQPPSLRCRGAAPNARPLSVLHAGFGCVLGGGGGGGTGSGAGGGGRGGSPRRRPLRPPPPCLWLPTRPVMPVALSLLRVVIAAAEELLFRGFLLTALTQRLGRVDAVAMTAALFGIAHLNIPQFFGLTSLGAACGAAAMASGSLLPAVLLHTAYNCTALAVGLAMTVAATGGTG